MPQPAAVGSPMRTQAPGLSVSVPVLFSRVVIGSVPAPIVIVLVVLRFWMNSALPAVRATAVP